MMVHVLRTHAFFAPLSEQTIYLIAYELIKVKKFQPKTLVMYQSKRSPTNFCYREFFERQMAQVQLDMIN
jgi:hypothetical protein